MDIYDISCKMCMVYPININHKYCFDCYCKNKSVVAKPVLYEEEDEEDISSVMKFGKYRGLSIKQISQEDQTYLVWLLKNLKGNRLLKNEIKQNI
jgi:hypothetical protein